MLFEPFQLGDLQLNNRIVMAPLTRCRAGEGRIPNALMAEYYAQRASAGLIISEATSISPMAVGYPNTPGIWTAEQTTGWKSITKAVHEAGGKIVLQLWHVGRISHPMYLNGEQPLAPSAIKPAGHVNLVRPKTEFVTPRALTTDEVKGIIEQYRNAAQNALEAGFDGVELHGANGYLLDQFLQSSTNQRTDEFGGNAEGRAKLLLDATDAAIGVWGSGRVGVHLSPRCDFHDMGDENPEHTFTHVAKELGKRNVAFIFTRENYAQPALSPKIRDAFGGALIANEQLDLAQANQLLHDKHADAVAFGKAFISNPDLVERLRSNIPLAAWDMNTFYSPGEQGYTDYPIAKA